MLESQKKFRVFIITVFIFLFSINAFAFSINISPPSARLKIKPGDTYSSTITVENKSDSPMDMRAYIEDWKYAKEGGKEFLPAGTTPLSCAKWITIHPQRFHLEPHARVGVQYSITVPPEAEGGHYAVIFFESAIDEGGSAQGNMLLRFAGRIGTIIYQETEGKINRAGEITEFSLSSPDQNSPLEIRLTLKNEGNTHIIAQGAANIIDKNGNTFGRQDLGPINTLPGDTRDYKAEWLGDLKEGDYDVLATLDGGLDAPLIAETTLSIRKSGEIKSIKVDTSKNPPSIKVLLSNTGNLNLKVEGKLDILDKDENLIESVPLKKVLVAPKADKEIESENPLRALQAGEYKVKALISVGDKELAKLDAFAIK